MDRPARLPLAWGVLCTALLLAGLAVFLIAIELPAFTDPCRQWGMPDTGTATLAPGGDCPGVSGTTETRAGAALRLALVPGIPLALSGVAAASVRGRHAAPLVGSGLVLAGHSLILFFLGLPAALVAMPVATVWLVAASRWRRPGPGRPR